MADDIAIRGEFSNEAFAALDMSFRHRFAYQPQGIDRRIGELEDIADAWAADEAGADGQDPELFVSAWNTVATTRNGVLADSIVEQIGQGNFIKPTDIDLEDRTSTDFDRFWQYRLDGAVYGQQHAAYMLESFASFAETGMAAGAAYVVEMINPGHLSWHEGGETFAFSGGEILKVIYESVGGTHVLASASAYDTHAPATVYGFETAHKLTVFVATREVALGETTL